MPEHWTVSGNSSIMDRVTRTLVMLAVLGACGKAPAGDPARIIDLSTSVAELRTEFDAHRGEPRFLTLLSPT